MNAHGKKESLTYDEEEKGKAKPVNLVKEAKISNHGAEQIDKMGKPKWDRQLYENVKEINQNIQNICQFDVSESNISQI